MREPITLRVDASEADPAEALDLLRRVRTFAEEMRSAGLDVAVNGALNITVRVPAMPKAEVVHAPEGMSAEEAEEWVETWRRDHA